MLEDDTGTMELIAFQKALDNGGSYVVDNADIIVKGRISLRDDKDAQLMVDSIRPLSDLHVLGTDSPPPQEKTLWLKLPSKYDPAMRKIELMLTMFPGEQRMIIWCEREKKRIGASCLIHRTLITELKELLGENNVIVK